MEMSRQMQVNVSVMICYVIMFCHAISSEVRARIKTKEKETLSWMSIVPVCRLLALYLCHPVGGACVWSKENRNRC